MFEDKAFVAKMSSIETRFEEVSNLLGRPEVISNRAEFTRLSKEHSDLAQLVDTWRKFRKAAEEIAGARALISDPSTDPDMKELAQEELSTLEDERSALAQTIKILLLPRDPNDEKNILLEIRAGTGGNEAALFAGDLFRMYMRYAERQGWKTDVMSTSEGTAGGFKEAIVLIEGKDVYSNLKYESGVHRVQRVPETESSGRIHTSAATVVVLPEAKDVDVVIDETELRIDTMRASGPGGQSVNTTDSAVRITHLPTNTVVICKDEKSQHKNKAKALKVLRSRLLDLEMARQQAEERDQRRNLVKTGDRSEKIRTYNFPQDRMTDHRIGLTKHNLPDILDGELRDTIDALRTHFQAEALNQAEAQ